MIIIAESIGHGKDKHKRILSTQCLWEVTQVVEDLPVSVSQSCGFTRVSLLLVACFTPFKCFVGVLNIMLVFQ